MAFLLPLLFSLCLLELCFGLLPILPILFLQPWECRSTSHSNKGSEQHGECAAKKTMMKRGLKPTQHRAGLGQGRLWHIIGLICQILSSQDEWEQFDHLYCKQPCFLLSP